MALNVTFCPYLFLFPVMLLKRQQYSHYIVHNGIQWYLHLNCIYTEHCYHLDYLFFYNDSKKQPQHYVHIYHRTSQVEKCFPSRLSESICIPILCVALLVWESIGSDFFRIITSLNSIPTSSCGEFCGTDCKKLLDLIAYKLYMFYIEGRSKDALNHSTKTNLFHFFFLL